jgi:predicted transcriptional regulator
MNTAILDAESLVKLFKVLSRPDALEVFLLAGEGIENSTSAIRELNISQKKYYTRLGELVDIGFIKKTEGTYRQTPIGNILCTRLLPAMEEIYGARDRLEILVQLDGTEMESGVRKLILDELEIPSFAGSDKGKIIEDYESMVVEVIDLCNSAEKSILMASNYLDVRVMEANFRSMGRGVSNRFIMGKDIFSSRLMQLRLMLSPKFTKAVMNLVTNSMEMENLARITDLPYSFIIVDGHLNIIEISDRLNSSFIVALLVKNREVGGKLLDLFEMLWDAGETPSMLGFLKKFQA